MAGNVPALNIARWDGAGWSALADGLDWAEGYYVPRVASLLKVEDETGSRLFASGCFTGLLYSAAWRCIAEWDGSTWSGFGFFTAYQEPTHIHVSELCLFDDGTGEHIYATGEFWRVYSLRRPRSRGMLEVNSITKWDGQDFHALGAGLTNPGDPPFGKTLATFDDGSGEALYVGGLFTTAGGLTVNGIARWNCRYLGDMNCDGIVNAYDIDPFLLALDDPDAYQSTYVNCNIALADVNGDGVINAYDIDPFIDQIANF